MSGERVAASGSSPTGARAPEHEIRLVRDAEWAVDRTAWSIHCSEFAADRAEKEAARNRADAAREREVLAAKQKALEAIRAQFPTVEPEEVDLHGVE